MKAMILAAGVGSRLDPLTRATPKPMVPILNKPVIEHIVELLRAHGFDEILINLHYLGDRIRERLGDGSRLGVRITYAIEDQLWGDAGSVKRAERFFDDTFLVIGGDDLSDLDVTELVQTHRKKKALATIALSLVEDPSEYGIVLLDEDGRVTRFLEKPKGEVVFSKTANMGVYVFEPEALAFIPAGTKYGLGNNLFPLLLTEQKPVYGHLTSAYWRDIGNLTQYRDAQYDCLAGKVKITIPLVEQGRSVWVGAGVEIDPTAEIGAPVAIGDGCRIGPGARILENSVLGNRCVVQENAVVRQSILWDDVTVGEQAILERCVVGSGCRVISDAAVFDGVLIATSDARR
jgi:mannose-1-phosphate guanylyltransferase/phosphomannomutase